MRAQARECISVLGFLVFIVAHGARKHTISSGATIQFSKTLKPICIHNCLERNARCSVSYCTLQRIGYIMTSNPMAEKHASGQHFAHHCIGYGLGHVPIGMDTPTNWPFFNAGPVLGTKFPSRMPMIIASKIQRARKRSSQPRLLNAETFSARGGRQEICFSESMVSCGDPLSFCNKVGAIRSSSGCDWSMVAICGNYFAILRRAELP